MIRLTRHTHYEPPNNFPVPRLLVEGVFELSQRKSASNTTFFKAIVDSGSPYVIIPYSIHRQGLQIYQDLGRQPYRITGSNPLLQSFAEVGVRFLITQPVFAFHPPNFLPVRAYLLEPGVAPQKVVIGLDAIEQHFTLYVPPPPRDAFLLESGDTIP